jgi:hypothetical protein
MVDLFPVIMALSSNVSAMALMFWVFWISLSHINDLKYRERAKNTSPRTTTIVSAMPTATLKLSP